VSQLRGFADSPPKRIDHIDNYIASSDASMIEVAGTVVIDFAKAGEGVSPSSVMRSFSSPSAISGSSTNRNKGRSSDAMTPCRTKASKLMISFH
jgi:hypothetical protein